MEGSQGNKGEAQTDKRLPTIVRLLKQFPLDTHVFMQQEECDKLLDATKDGNEEVLTTLIGDGVDMDSVIFQVC